MPAPQSEECIALFLIVNAGGNWRQTESGRDADSCPTHLEGHLITAQCSHPRPVELQPPNRGTRQPVERPHPAPDFVDNESYTKPLQRIEVGRLSGDEGFLGYSQFQAIGRYSSLCQETLDVPDEIVVQNVMSQRSERNTDICVRLTSQCDEIVAQTRQDSA
jgi:hypothetical protein